MTANTASSGSIPRRSTSPSKMCAGSCTPTIGSIFRTRSSRQPRTPPRSRANFAFAARMGSSAGASERRSQPWTPRTMSCASRAVTVDITDRKEAEEHQALLAREVDHRARNALALVQSIVRLTHSDNIKSYITAVDGRIGALARAHTLLAQSRWQGADLARLVNEELAPFRTDGPERAKIAGPDVSLEPRTAQTLALALHELATNAAKYGALSVRAGRVAVDWDLQPHGLLLRWTESGGPQPQPPVAPGFGIRLISASIERQLAGEAVFDWRPEGLYCTLRVPCRDQIEALSHRAGAHAR